MITVDNSYDAVAEHSRAAHKRDIVFGVVLAVVITFALGSLNFSSKRVAHAPSGFKHCIVGTSC